MPLDELRETIRTMDLETELGIPMPETVIPPPSIIAKKLGIPTPKDFHDLLLAKLEEAFPNRENPLIPLLPPPPLPPRPPAPPALPSFKKKE